MMYKLIILFFLLSQGFTVFATDNRSDSLLPVLDKTIKEKSLYAEKKERRIDSLKLWMNSEADMEQRYYIYKKLYEEYGNYNMNSALSVAEKKLMIATELQNQQLINTSEMNISKLLGVMGMYKESLDRIDKIDRQKLDRQQWTHYFHLYHSLYILMSENSLSLKGKNHYDQLISLYKDSLLQSVDSNTSIYNVVKSVKLVEQERYDEALFLMNQNYKEYGNDESLRGTLAYELSNIYAKKGDTEQEKQYLAIASIADLKNAAKDYIALRKLAVLLYREGDINRAYNYIKCSMEDAAFCGARFRMMEIAEILPIINAAYDKKVAEEKEKLFKYLILISVLTLVLVISLFFIWRQMKKLSLAKKSMKDLYEGLKQMNNDLEELNKKLSESNHVKEEYIGSVFNLCSTYINKMESYRININRKLVSNQIEEARKATGSTLIGDEFKEFFCNFDAIFLSIYPNFIEEFNSLLIEGEQIIPKTGNILTPELRVFALIRLGITDSGKIATFLHYSPQTVYNYKLKIRNKLSLSADEFAVAIQQIGK